MKEGKVCFNEIFFNSIKYIHEVKIFNEIQNNKKIIIFDFRNREEYLSNHLDLSLNIPFDEHELDYYETLFDKKLNITDQKYIDSEEVKLRLKNCRRYFIVIIMSEERIKRKAIENCERDQDINLLTKEKILKTLLFYKSLVIKGVRDIGIYNLGIKELTSQYKFMMHSRDIKPLIK